MTVTDEFLRANEAWVALVLFLGVLLGYVGGRPSCGPESALRTRVRRERRSAPA